MNVVLWVLQGLLAVAFVGAGGMKLATPRQQLLEKGMGWVEPRKDAEVKAVGAVEVLGGLGLVLPWATGIAPVLTPVAAAGLVITMVIAVGVHLKEGDVKGSVPAAVLAVLSLVVAIGRF
ncbi:MULTISPECIES: DoxX family protein [Actinosynnema]|uniref:DoxX family protein n=1 Tax=Actinosynnema TaxID=40566 RepID=UPI0020A47FB7|nr:DoxX family protein [Actinosynnema pretiosum]MCP2092706.1 DoxX-like family protein [Actinosynnema pretiosum]